VLIRGQDQVLGLGYGIQYALSKQIGQHFGMSGWRIDGHADIMQQEFILVMFAPQLG